MGLNAYPERLPYGRMPPGYGLSAVDYFTLLRPA
jgi:hypothetical protein